MSEEERQARRNPISNLVDLSIGFRGRREWLVLLTDRFRINLDLEMSKIYELKNKNIDTAEELFKKVGYMKRCDVNSMVAIISYIQNSSGNIIYFDYDGRIDVGSCFITSDLLKAINKQTEELGWSNE